MNYYLFKLRFSTSVHFGSSDSALSLYNSKMCFCADTLFSALCHQVKRVKGDDSLHSFIDAAENGRILFSDAMPWSENDYFLPKPYFVGAGESEVEASKRKAMKKLMWIPLSAFGSFVDSVKGKCVFDVGSVRKSFGVSDEFTRVKIADGNDSLPYQIAAFTFDSDCGLYFIAGFDSVDDYNLVVMLSEGLGLDGIGGKTSSGLGKFTVEDVIDLKNSSSAEMQWLNGSLNDSSAEKQLLLTTSLPDDCELDDVIKDASFQLTRRGGFILSEDYAQTPRKKKTEYFFGIGSVLSHRFRGGIREVGMGGSHPVYRYSEPVFLGVDL